MYPKDHYPMHPFHVFNEEELAEIRREELLALKPGQQLNVRNRARQWGRGVVVALDIREGEVRFVAVMRLEGEDRAVHWVSPEDLGYIYPLHTERHRDVNRGHDDGAASINGNAPEEA
jgi:hypothetical protein